MVWQRKFDLGGIPSSRTIILRSNMDDERNSKTNGLELAVLLENQLEKAFKRKTAKYANGRVEDGMHCVCSMRLAARALLAFKLNGIIRLHRKGAITHRKCQEGLDQEA